jgi:hypothetical protein
MQNFVILHMQQHFQPDQLAQFAQYYQAGTSLSDIIPQNTDELGRPLRPSRSTILRYWHDPGLSRLVKGRPKMELSKSDRPTPLVANGGLSVPAEIRPGPWRIVEVGVQTILLNKLNLLVVILMRLCSRRVL